MGKLIAFPGPKLERRPKVGRTLFQAFNELQLLERTELKLVGACTAGAALLMAALELVSS